jgi:hypothetical protein
MTKIAVSTDGPAEWYMKIKVFGSIVLDHHPLKEQP